jgi:hypothetical protein
MQITQIMKHIKFTFFSILILFSFSNLFAQKYIGVDFGLQKLSFRSVPDYSEWVMNTYINNSLTPTQIGFSYIKSKNKFQWQTGLHYRHYALEYRLTEFHNPDLGNAEMLSKIVYHGQIGVPLIVNYLINNSETIQLRPFAGLHLNVDLCMFCHDNFQTITRLEFHEENDDVVESEFYWKGFNGFAKNNLIQMNMVYGLNADFPIGKENQNLFRFSIIRGIGLIDANSFRWFVTYNGETSHHSANWDRMNYYSLQFSYLHRLGKNKE